MEKKPDNNKPSKEIDIIGLLKSLWVERTLVIKVCFFSAILGVFMALNSPKIYTTSVVLAPESSDPSSSLSKLGSLTSMLGLKMGSTISSDAIFPELYPQVLASTDFQISLFDIPVRLLEDENTKTYYRHLIEDSFIPVWRWPQIWISSLFKKKTEPKPLNPFHLTSRSFARGLCKAHKMRKKPTLATLRNANFGVQIKIVPNFGVRAAGYKVGVYHREVELRTCDRQEHIYNVKNVERAYQNKRATFNLFVAGKEIIEYYRRNHRVVGKIAQIKSLARPETAAHLLEHQRRLKTEKCKVKLCKNVVEVSEYPVKFESVGVPIRQ